MTVNVITDHSPSYSAHPKMPVPTSEQISTAALANTNPSTIYPAPTFLQPRQPLHDPLANHDHVAGVEDQDSSSFFYTQGTPRRASQHRGAEHLQFAPPSHHGRDFDIDDVSPSSVFDWATSFDPTRGGATTAVAVEEGYDPSMIPKMNTSTGNPLGNGFVRPVREDSIQTLFQHSFDIWSSLDNADHQNIGDRRDTML